VASYLYFILRVRVYDLFPEVIVPIISEQSLGLIGVEFVSHNELD